MSEAARKVADARRDERDRRRRSLQRRRFAVIAGLVLVIIALIWGLAALWRAPIFPVRTVEVSGNHRLKTADVIAMARLAPDETLLRVNRAQVRDQLLASPWIDTVEVSRDFPGTLRIAITERAPAAVVDAGGTSLWLVSADGHWLGPRAAEDTMPLVPIRDVENAKPIAGRTTNSAELRNALAILSGITPELHARVRAVSAPSIDKTALLLDNDVQVFMGSAEDLGKKDQLVREILAKQKNVVYINVRVPERAVWRGLGKD